MANLPKSNSWKFFGKLYLKGKFCHYLITLISVEHKRRHFDLKMKSHWGPVLFRTPLTFTVWAKTVEDNKVFEMYFVTGPRFFTITQHLKCRSLFMCQHKNLKEINLW